MQLLKRLGFLGTIVIGSAAGLLTAGIAWAQVVPPRPLEQRQLEPPEGRLGMPMEGWVVLRYSVLADGTTANVRVIDRMPPELPDRAALWAVEDSTFEPATADGTAIEWHNNEAVHVFDVESIPEEPSPLFLRAYREVDELIAANEHGKALKRNQRMLTVETSRLAEIGLAQTQSAIVNLSLGDLHAAYAAILRATDPRMPVLGTAELSVALQYRNALELQLGHLVRALETFERRDEIEPVPDSDLMASRAEAIKEALDTDAAITVSGKIADKYWPHTLARSTFAIGNVDGTLRNIHVECDRRSTDLKYAEDSEWTLPESWGACSLMVEGRRDTAFVLYEFP